MGSKERFVVPGDLLAVIEEYFPGEGTYVLEERGEIRAAVAGHPFIDVRARRLNVRPAGRTPKVPKRGSTVYGYVSMVPRDDLALVRTTMEYPLLKIRELEWFPGILHISQASDKYVNSIYQVVRLGDIVKAQVLNSKPPYILSIRQPSYGVVAALCSRCGALLEKRPGTHLLICPRCGNKESRKTSPSYMYPLRGR